MTAKIYNSLVMDDKGKFPFACCVNGRRVLLTVWMRGNGLGTSIVFPADGRTARSVGVVK